MGSGFEPLLKIENVAGILNRSNHSQNSVHNLEARKSIDVRRSERFFVFPV
jgi:hypothetical protein